MNIITGYRGEPHITSGQDRAQNQGTYGTGSYILDVGRKLAAEIVSANEIRIRDGVLSHQGCIANIEQGAYDSLEIANGTQGMSRIDLIVARYTKDAETNVEDVELVVIEGTAAASSPAVPSYNTGDIQAGDSPVDMPLYRVNISGVNIGSVTQVASTVRTQAETDALLGNTSIAGIGGGTLTGAVSQLNSNIETVASKVDKYVKIDQVTTTWASIGANSASERNTVDVPQYAGYVPAFVAPASISNNRVCIYSCYLSNNKIYVQCQNYGAAASNVTASIAILYIKN